jgi:hypothetical protein
MRAFIKKLRILVNCKQKLRIMQGYRKKSANIYQNFRFSSVFVSVDTIIWIFPEPKLRETMSFNATTVATSGHYITKLP